MGLGECIGLYGPDGSGKTTLALLLYRELESSGGRPVISWMRGSHNVASLVARLLSKTSLRGPCNPYHGFCIPPSMTAPWTLLEVASALPVILARFVVPRLLGFTIVGMRSPLDLLAWIHITAGGKGVGGGLTARAATLALSRLCRHVLVTASPRSLARRRRGSPEEPTLASQWRLYEEIARLARTPRIDTTRTSPKEALDELSKIMALNPIL